MKVTLSLIESLTEDADKHYKISQRVVSYVEDGLDISQAVTRYLAEDGQEFGYSEKDVAEALEAYPVSNTAGSAMVSESHFHKVIREELSAVRALKGNKA